MGVRITDFLRERAKWFVRDESGATAIEYALVAVGISIAIAASVDGVREALMTNFYEKLAAAFAPSPDAP